MKLHRLTLVSIAIVAVLAGCGKSSSPTSANLPTLDTTPPPVPEALSATVEATTNQPLLTWDASTAPDVTGYEVFGYMPDPSRMDSYVFLDYTSQPRWSVIGLSPSTSGHYRVRAVDEAGNRSGFTADLQVDAAPAQSLPPPEPTAPPTGKQHID